MRSKNSEIRLVEGHPTAEHDDGERPRIDPIASRQAQLMSGMKRRCPEHQLFTRDREGARIHRDRRRSSRRMLRRTAGGSIRLGRRSVAVAVASAAASSYLSATIIFAAVMVTWTCSLPNAALASSSAPVAEVAVRCPSSCRPRSTQLIMLTGMLPRRSPSLGVPSRHPNHRRRVHLVDYRAVVDPRLLLRGGGDDESSLPKSLPQPPPSSVDVDDVGVDASISAIDGGEGRKAPEMMTTPFDDQLGRNFDSEPLPEEGGWEGTGTPSSERTSSSVLLTTPHRSMPAVSVALREVIVGDHDRDREDTDRTTAVVTMATAEPVLVTKFELSRRLVCPLRDLRIVDPKYGGATAIVGIGPSPSSSTSSVRVVAGPRQQHSNTAFLPRRGGVVVHAGAARAIVMEREVLLFGTTGGAGTGTDVVDVDGLVGFLLDHLNSVFGEAGNIAEPQEDGGGGRKGGSGRRGATTSSSRQPSERRAHDYRKRTGQRPPPPPPPPFELVVIEAILSYVCTEEAERAASVIETAREVLEGIEFGGGRSKDTDDDTAVGSKKKNNKRAKKASFMIMQSRLGQLLPLKNRLDELEANCAEVASAIVEVLRSDEDMEAMIPSRRRLLEGRGIADGADARRGDHTGHHHHGVGGAPMRSDYPHHTTHHGRRDTVRNPPPLPPTTAGGHAEEVELLFEDSLLRMEEVLYSLRSVQSAVRNTEEVVEIELDVMRNRILRYELLLESSGLAVGCGAAITGLFGMNLVSHYEDHAKMFYYVTAFIVVLMAAIGFGIVSQLEIYNIW